MLTDDEFILTIAGLSRDCLLLDEAVLVGDFLNARLRASLMHRSAAKAGFRALLGALDELRSLLGPTDGLPHDGYASAMLRVADALDDVWLLRI